MGRQVGRSADRHTRQTDTPTDKQAHRYPPRELYRHRQTNKTLKQADTH